jgi:hypothetical protein
MDDQREIDRLAKTGQMKTEINLLAKRKIVLLEQQVDLLRGKLNRMRKRCDAITEQRAEAWRIADVLRVRMLNAVTSILLQDVYGDSQVNGFSLRDGRCDECEGTGGTRIDSFDTIGPDHPDYNDPQDGAHYWCPVCHGVGHTYSVMDKL